MSESAIREKADVELLERARSGDRDALERLLERHQAKVYRFGMRMCREPEDAKDVVQDTLLAMARGVRDFRGESSVSTWLFSIARRFCIKKRRTRRSDPSDRRSLDTDLADEVSRVADPAKSAEELLAGREIERELDDAIAALEPKYREVLVLRDVEGLTAPEAAEVLGIGVQAVKSRLHRARASVRERIVARLGLPEEVRVAEGRCPDVVTLFSKHLEGEISAGTCAEMERHLARCPRCRGACDSLRRTLALCRTAGTSVEVPASVRQSVTLALHDFLSTES